MAVGVSEMIRLVSNINILQPILKTFLICTHLEAAHLTSEPVCRHQVLYLAPLAEVASYRHTDCCHWLLGRDTRHECENQQQYCVVADCSLLVGPARMARRRQDEMDKRHGVNSEEETAEAEANQEGREDDDIQQEGRNRDRLLDEQDDCGTSHARVVAAVNTSREDGGSRCQDKAAHVGIEVDNAVGTNMRTANAGQAAKLQRECHSSQGSDAEVVVLAGEGAVVVAGAGAQMAAGEAVGESGNRYHGNDSAKAETGMQDKHVCRNQCGHIHERLDIPAQVCNPSDRRNTVHEYAYEEEDYATQEGTRCPKDNRPAGSVRCLRFCFQTGLGQPNVMLEQNRWLNQGLWIQSHEALSSDLSKRRY